VKTFVNVLKFEIIDSSKFETQCCGSNKPQKQSKEQGTIEFLCYTTIEMVTMTSSNHGNGMCIYNTTNNNTKYIKMQRRQNKKET
jgi:hypothetical protein